jgi:hypothetical protein
MNGSGQGPFAQSADGWSFTTFEPFTVDDFLIFMQKSSAPWLTLADAQAILDQAVLDGDVSTV